MNQQTQTGSLEQEVKSVRQWWHSIDLGNGMVTAGRKTPQVLTHELETMHLPDLKGKTVLDVGAWDGFFSFEAERRGASRVVALDHFIWSLDPTETALYRKRCKETGERIGRYEESPKVWRPDLLLGKRGFDVAHRALGSRVECKVADFLTMKPEEIGIFDVVFFMGVLYHMENPLESLRWLASVTDGLAIIETAVVALPGYESCAFAEFYEQDDLQGDPTNWWAPNRKALEGMCRAAGFEHVEVVAWPWDLEKLPSGVCRGRGVVHACKKKPVLPYQLLLPQPLRNFKARIEPQTQSIVLQRGKGAVIPVKVHNNSPDAWTPERKIHVSYHLLDEKGRVLLWEGARSCLPRTLQPGEEIVVDCNIAPIGDCERCQVEFDLIQEQVTWFKGRGTLPVRIPCTLAPAV